MDHVLSNIVNAQDLLSMELAEPEWVVPGILPSGVCILAGKPKVGKSWLAVQIAIAVSNGGTVLGDYSASQGACLYLGLEDNNRRLKFRLQKLQINQSEVPFLDIATQWERNPSGVDAIREWIARTPNAKLVVIDTLEAIRGKRQNNNAYAEDYEAIAAFRQVHLEFGVSFLIVHHQRKKASDNWLDTVLGSTGITGSTDTIWLMERRKQSHSANLMISGRDVLESQQVVIFDEDTMRCTSMGAAESYPDSKAQQELYIVLKQADVPMRPMELARELEKEPGTIRKLLFEMTKNGTVSQIGHGQYIAADSGSHLN